MKKNILKFLPLVAMALMAFSFVACVILFERYCEYLPDEVELFIPRQVHIVDAQGAAHSTLEVGTLET